MLSLLSVLRPITNLGYNTLACHNATLYYLFHATYGTTPDEEDFHGGTNVLSRGQVRISQLAAKHGSRVERPKHKMLRLTPGSILVFHAENEAKHSCIAINEHQLYGYNQTGWFSKPGREHGLTMHSVDEIQWVDHPGANTVVAGGGGVKKLYTIPEAKARQWLLKLDPKS